jgi:CopA family copper-resistance protein
MLVVILLYAGTYARAQDMGNMKMPGKSGTKAKVKTIYTCVMHPEIQMAHPGNCPKCGMRLVKKTIKLLPTGVNQPGMDMGKSMQRGKETMNGGMKMDMLKKDTMTSDEMGMGMVPESVNFQPGKIVRYDLYVTDTIVNFTGKSKHAYAINGVIPAPTLIFTEGDTAEIYLHNNLKKESTSLHWHGVILPNQFDGVPYLTSARIGPGETHLYKFPIVQNGTYWYHSHTAFQEQAGLYGALIFNKRNTIQSHKPNVSKELFDKEYTVILSEWTDEKPSQVQRRLRTANDWYAIKKGSTQSYAEAIKQGYFKTKVVSEWKRMKAMDVSDVYYNKFLINGRPIDNETVFKAGDKVKLRVVNGGASSYFWLQYAGGKITVIANDGNDVVPVETDRLIIGPSETYDLVVYIKDDMSYEFRATPEDRTGAASLWLGSGMKMPAPAMPRLKYFEGMKMMNGMMKMNGDMKNMGMQMSNQKMDMNMVMYPEMSETGSKDMADTGKMDMAKAPMGTSGKKMNDMGSMAGMDMDNSSGMVTLNYDMLRSPVKTILPDGPTKTLYFTLTGNMNRYVWSINNKTVTEADKILIKKGENVHIILKNNSMMRHPMHLHGHDFRVKNSQGEFSPLKNVIDIMPMEVDTLEFAANQSGNWFFHCHILYHMMAGMGRVFTYENSPLNPELPDTTKANKMFKMDNSMYHLMVKAGLETNGSEGEAMVSSNRYALQQIWHLGYHPEHGYESETNIGRYFGTYQWLFAYVGFDYHYKKNVTNGDGPGLIGKNIFGDEAYTMFGQRSDKDNRHTIVAGVQYTLPLLVTADLRIDGNGKFRFQLSREDVPITQRLRFNIMANTDKEYAIGLRYIVTRWYAVSTHYDSDMGLGIGVTLTY